MEILAVMDKIAFYVFNKPIAWYGLIVTSAIVMSFILFIFLAKKRGIDLDFSLELFIWVIILAVLGCRLGYVLPRPEFFPKNFTWQDFKNIFDITYGGLTIIGGLLGGAFGVLFCCLRNKKYSFAKVADCVVIALIMGQIIGRWGNFVNQELFGIEITDPSMQWFPLAVYIDDLGGYYCASFFYEGVLNAIGLAIAITLFYKFDKKLKPGAMLLLYLSWYGLVRGSLEFIKYDHVTLPGTDIGMVQIICLVMAVVCAILFVLLQKGKIRFETKWFQTVIAKNEEKLKNLELAKSDNAEEKGNNLVASIDSNAENGKAENGNAENCNAEEVSAENGNVENGNAENGNVENGNAEEVSAEKKEK